MASLAQTVKTLEEAAKKHGLLIFHGVPELSTMPVARWQSDWQSFLDFAAKLKADTLYTYKEVLDLESSVRSALLQAGLLLSDNDSEHETAKILFDRVMDEAGKFKTNDGEVVEAQFVWIHNGIAHELSFEDTTLADGSSIIDDLIEQAQREKTEATAQEKQSERQKQTVLADTEHQRLNMLAEQMVQHEPFLEAKNEAKRSYMAGQLFPEETNDNHILIAELAVVIHWWHYEPQERVAKTQKALELHTQGIAIKNIAGLLQMPEAQVMACIAASRKAARIEAQSGMDL